MGALTLNSCVDDNESASVTAIRTAKAEQLKAIGEAAKTQADAQATAAAAYAAVQAAQAKLIAAQEAAQLAQTQIDQEKAAAEIQKLKEELAASIALTNAKIEQIKAAAEAQLLQNQQAQLDNQNQQNSQLLGLLSQYSSATVRLVDAQRRLVDAQNNLAAWEAELTAWEDLRPERIAAKQDEINEMTQAIAENDAQLQTLNQYYGNIAAAQEQLTAAQAESSQLHNKLSAASADQAKARVDNESAEDYITNSRYQQLMEQLGSLNVGDLWYSDSEGDYDVSLVSYRGALADRYVLRIYDGNNTKDFPLSSADFKSESITYTIEEGQQQFGESYNVYPETFLVMTEKLYKDAEAALNKYVKEHQEAGVTAAQKAHDDYVAAADKVAKAAAEMKAANDVVNKIVADGGTPTAAQTADLTAKQAAHTAAVAAYETAYGYYNEDDVKPQTESYARSLADAKDALTKAQAVVAQLASIYKSLSAEQGTYVSYIAPLNTTEKAYAEARVARSKAGYANNANDTEIRNLQSIIDGGKVRVTVYNEDGTTSYGEEVTIVEAMGILERNKEMLAENLEGLNEDLTELENEAYSSDEGWTEDEKRQALTEDVEDAQMKVDSATKVADALKDAIDKLTAEPETQE